MIEPVRGFRTPEACRLAGITYRQADFWCRSGLVVPTVRDARGSGSQRLYGRPDVVRLVIVRVLLDAGMSFRTIRLHLDAIADSLAPGTTMLTLGPHASVTLNLWDLVSAIPEPDAQDAPDVPGLSIVR